MAINRRKFIRDTSLIVSAGALGATACSESGQPAPPLTAAPAGSDKPELLASYWTISGDADPAPGGRAWSPFDFRERVEAISRAGFTGMGIWHDDLYHVLETRSLSEMRRILDDNGIRHIELEFLFDWFHPDGSEAKIESDRQKARLLEAAEILGARHLKVGDFINQQVDFDQATESFAALCSDAADVGTNILFEAMPFAMIDNLPDSIRMVDQAGAANGGLMIDTWHIVKWKLPYEELARVPLRYVMGVEINDGMIETPEGMDLQTETTQYREFPGEGEFDMAGFMSAIAATGYEGPYGVEVINRNNRGRSLDELAERAFRTSMAMFATN
jgi:sugar phosphate isomerase/epimerase